MGGYVLHADFVSASGVNVGDPVKIAGVKVGTVQSISLADYQARVAFRIKDTVEVHEDASASIETEGLIGDRSISIDPGTAGEKPLGPGDEIKDTDSPLSITEFLGTFLTGDLASGG
jgi:phospholipid/cholesterol/gamma-HCH transport system substrate-binding protein